jgi:hypothetical protein
VTRFWYTLKNLDTMVSFGYPKHKKTSKFAWKQFEIKSSFWVKINLDRMVKWREIGYNQSTWNTNKLHFSKNHNVSCLWFMKHYQTKEKKEVNAMLIYKISSSFI